MWFYLHLVSPTFYRSLHTRPLFLQSAHKNHLESLKHNNNKNHAGLVYVKFMNGPVNSYVQPWTQIINKCSQKISSSSYHPYTSSLPNETRRFWQEIGPSIHWCPIVLVQEPEWSFQHFQFNSFLKGTKKERVDRMLYLRKCYLTGIALSHLKARNIKLYSCKSLCLQLWKITFLKSHNKNYYIIIVYAGVYEELYWNSTFPYSLQMEVRKLSQIQITWAENTKFNLIYKCV